MAAAPTLAKAPVAFLCDRYGPGFYAIPGIPGTSGCLKVGGYIRAQGAWGASGDGIPTGADAMAPQGVQTRTNFNDANYQARAALSLDARVATGWGDLRGYARFGAEVVTPFGNSIAPNLQNAPVVFWDRGYIQYVGGTIGKTRSFFDLFALTDGYLTYGNPRASGDSNLYGVLLAGYTARFGDGFSASVSVEDPNGHNKTGPLNFGVAGWGLGTLATTQLGGEGLNQRGYSVPDIIGNLRVDQSWGYLGVSGAIHQVAGSYYSQPGPANPAPLCAGAASTPAALRATGMAGPSRAAARSLSRNAARHFRCELGVRPGAIDAQPAAPFGSSMAAMPAPASAGPMMASMTNHSGMRWPRLSEQHRADDRVEHQRRL